jgi:phosphohistidine swiveling domain-containing protein
MGSLGRTGLPYLLMGSTAVKVARQLPCSLLTVKREQVMAVHLEQNIADINAAFQEGQELLAQGFCKEALSQFERCLQLDPHFAHEFQPGEILLAPMTSPEYVFAMRKAAAVITDAGGLTSHAAIVSRELGIPCIVGTKVATKVFKDGDRVEVDITKGIARRI